jgi:hypothetical protein
MNRLLRVSLLIFAMLGFASAATQAAADPPPGSQSQGANLIVPGVSLGPVRLGMTETELYNTLGEPTSSFIGESATVYNYPTLSAYVDKRSHRIDRIATGSSIYSTKEGISVGSSMMAVSVKLGPHGGCDSPVGGCTFWYKGLGVTASTAAIVTGFWVLRN